MNIPLSLSLILNQARIEHHIYIWKRGLISIFTLQVVDGICNEFSQKCKDLKEFFLLMFENQPVYEPVPHNIIDLTATPPVKLWL